MSVPASGETLEERLNRLEREIQGLKAQAAQREAELAEIKAAAKAAPPAPAKPVEGDVWTKYNMRLYGRVKIDVNYDTAQIYNNDWAATVKTGSGYTNDSTNFNPRDTRFGFEASHTDGDWTGLGRFEVDFYGSNAPGDSGNNLIPRMRLGYVKLLYNPCDTSFLIGQDWIPVAQLNPNTIDFGILTAAGNLWWRVPQVTVRKQIGDFELLVSAMKHRRTDTADEARMPWVLGRMAYDGGILGKGNSVALGGGYRTETLYKTGAIDGHRIDRYLLAAEFKLARGPFTLRAEPWIGQGIGDEFQRYDMSVNYHDGTGDTANPEAVWAIGGFVDMTYQANPKLSFTVGYGVDDPKDEDVVGIGDNTGADANRQFTMNSQLFFNTWYQLTKAIKVGAELIHLKTERFSETNSGNRFTVSTWYEF